MMNEKPYYEMIQVAGVTIDVNALKERIIEARKAGRTSVEIDIRPQNEKAPMLFRKDGRVEFYYGE